MISNWDGQRLTVCGLQQDVQTAMHVESQTDALAWCELTPEKLASQPNYLLWPLEELLVRNVSFDLPHVKFVDQDILANEIEEACDEDASQWWLSALIAKRDAHLTGVLLGLRMSDRDALAKHAIWQHCPSILPDTWVRLLALLPETMQTQHAVLDEDESGICIGVFDAEGCCALRRINQTTWRNAEMMAEEVRRSLQAMHVRESDPVIGCCGAMLFQNLQPMFADWQVEQVVLSTREVSNILALRHVIGTDKTKLHPANLRHDAWANQHKIHINWRCWRISLYLGFTALLVLLVGQQVQVRQLEQHNHQLEQNIEMAFRAALPEGPQNYEPLAQLRQAAGKVSDVDAWYFLEQLKAIAVLTNKQPDLHIQKIQLRQGEMFLSAQVKDFATVNRVQAMLADILQVKVQVEDTELDSQKSVRFRMKWS